MHSNYFVAKARFRREWLAINEQMFAVVRAGADDLGKALTAFTSYQTERQRALRR
jgi:hypothetical protein